MDSTEYTAIDDAGVEVESRMPFSSRRRSLTLKFAAFFVVVLLALVTFRTSGKQLQQNFLVRPFFYDKSCYKRCMFKFCHGDATLKVDPYHPDVPLTGPVCVKTKYGLKKIGSIDESGEAIVQFKYHFLKGYIPISLWKPKGLKQAFSPSFFKAYYIQSEGASGVGHETPQQNQAQFFRGTCVLLPIVKWQVLGADGNVVANPTVRRYPWNNCVAFEAY